MQQLWEWRPKKTIGPIRFGDPISHIQLAFSKTLDEHDGSDQWCEYESESEGVRAMTCNGVITSVSCERWCWFKGVNLVGMDGKKALRLVGKEPDRIERDALGYTVGFEDLGLELYVVDDLVQVASVFVDPDTTRAITELQ